VASESCISPITIFVEKVKLASGKDELHRKEQNVRRI
jgi:hypothetical protein